MGPPGDPLGTTSNNASLEKRRSAKRQRPMFKSALKPGATGRGVAVIPALKAFLPQTLAPLRIGSWLGRIEWMRGATIHLCAPWPALLLIWRKPSTF